MKLTHPIFSEPIFFRENRVQVLAVEAPGAFRKLVTELTRQSEGGEGAFVLSCDDVCLDPAEHLQVIFDYIHPQTLEKRLLNNEPAPSIQPQTLAAPRTR